MERLAETGHGSEGLVALPSVRRAVVDMSEIGERVAITTPPPHGVLLGAWSDPSPDETPVAVGAWSGSLTTFEVALEGWDA